MGAVTVWSSTRRFSAAAAAAVGCGAAICITGAGIAIGCCMPLRGWRLMRTDSSPSEISSSEMPDSSSSSMSFLTLRMSIRDPLEKSLVLSVDQAGACGLERQLVADGSQSEDAADRDAG